MTKIDSDWLFKRGDLHDARITDIRRHDSRLEIDIHDEWVNERRLELLEEEVFPATLIFFDAVVSGTIPKDGWIIELLMEPDGSFILGLRDGTRIPIHGSHAECWPIVPGQVD